MSFNSAVATPSEKRRMADRLERLAPILGDIFADPLLFDATKLRLWADREEKELG